MDAKNGTGDPIGSHSADYSSRHTCVVCGGCQGGEIIMFVRIISGEFGGRKIEAPDNSRTHPMGERVRNALFNSLGEKIVGASVLDAFAGTGSVGLEALSRGAKHATFIER